MSSPVQKPAAGGSGTQPREVIPVSVLTESELGSEAQRERRKRILDATLAIASKGGYEAVQMRAVADRADVAVGVNNVGETLEISPAQIKLGCGVQQPGARYAIMTRRQRRMAT